MQNVTLYHYTCEHSMRHIALDRYLKPRPHPVLPELYAAVWLTDQAVPDRIGLGLTSELITCDRTQYRVAVHTDEASRWVDVAHKLGLDPARRDMIERHRQPMSWWVAFARLNISPLDIARAPGYGASLPVGKVR